MGTVDTFRELARHHIALNAFYYGRAYEKGFGEELHPLLWLDDPITGRSAGPNNNAISVTVNFDVLGLPKDSKNDKDVERIQDAAMYTALSLLEKIGEDPFAALSVAGWTWITLRDYYDNNAAGVRFTVELTAANPAALCDNPFDPDKDFSTGRTLPDFNVDHASGCEVFNDGKVFPDFTLR